MLNTELAALQAADAGVTLASLQVTRQTGATCDNDFISTNGTNTSLAQLANASATGYSWIRVNTPGFSKFFVHRPSVRMPVKIFLQGAYKATAPELGRHRNNTAAWVTALNSGTVSVPAAGPVINALNQPYNFVPFSYTGTESIGSFPATTNTGSDRLDWVLLELRDGTTPATVIARRAAFIRCDGRIVDLDGVSDVSFKGVPSGTFHMVIRHRNHLPVRTSTNTGLSASLGATAPASYDFNTGQAKAYQNIAVISNPAMKDLGAGVFGMWGGNGNGYTVTGAPFVRASGPTAQNDYLFLLQTTLGGNVSTILPNKYHPGDMNMDGQVRASGPTSQNDYIFLLQTVLGGNVSTIYNQHQ